MIAALAPTLSAQQTEQKKVIIIEQTTDENGDTKVERREYSGAEAEEFLKKDSDILRLNIDEKALDKTLEEMEGRIKILTDGFEGELDLGNLKELDLEKMFENFKGFEDLEKMMPELEGQLKELLESMPGIDSKKSKKTSIKIMNYDTKDDKPFLGVYTKNRDGFDGLYVYKIVKGSAAEAAGIQRGDYILSINGTKTVSPDALSEVITSKKVGEKISVQINREGRVQTISAKLNAYQKPEWSYKKKSDCGVMNKKAEDFMRGRRNYMFKSPCTPKQYTYLGVAISNTDKGVLVGRVEKQSPAAAVGIQKGDVITSVNRTRIADVDQLIEVIKSKNAGEKIKVNITRENGKSETLKPVLAMKVIDCGRVENVQEEEIEIREDNTLLEKIQGNQSRNENSSPLKAEINISTFSAFPNPSSGAFTIEIAGTSNQELKLTIANQEGKTVFSDDVKAFQGDMKMSLNLNLAPGIYSISLQGNKYNQSRRLVIQ